MAEDALDRLKNRTRSSVPPRDASLVDPKSDLGQPLPQLPPKEQVMATTPINTPSSPSTALPETNLAGLMRFCSEANITKDVFSEAAFRVCAQNPKFLHEVMQIAHRRHDAQQHDALVQRQQTIQQTRQAPDADENSNMWLL